MPRIDVRAFEERDSPAAAALLAARHRRDRARLPMLAASLEDPTACGDLLSALAANKGTSGAVASVGGETAGFLSGATQLFAPTHFASQFIPPHSISMPVDGHAVASGHDPTAV